MESGSDSLFIFLNCSASLLLNSKMLHVVQNIVFLFMVATTVELDDVRSLPA